MTPQVRIVGLLAVVGLCLITTSADAVPKKKTVERTDAALESVRQVLQAEVVGAVDRRAQLAGALKEQPAAPAPRWQAGYIREDNRWRSFDEPPLSTAEV